MASPSTTSNAAQALVSGAFPVLLVVQGAEQREIPIKHTPFGIGRRTDKDLVIADPRVSRDHAEIVTEDRDYYVVDNNSKHGTFVNGERVVRHKLARNDRIEFGIRDGAYTVFNPLGAASTEAREFLSQISAMEVRHGASDLEKLTLFLDAARRLNTIGALEGVLVTLIESTLRLTGAERGFVFLREPDGSLRLAAGRTAKGEVLADDRAITRSILEEAAASASDFLLTDTSKLSGIASRQSIMAYDLRTVICIPLRRAHGSLKEGVQGVLYLDSRFASSDMSQVSHEILGAIANEAAALVENANLVQAQEEARRYQQELSIAASIHHGLMAVTIPDVPFASLRAQSLACRDIGGDFYDVVLVNDRLNVVMTDVSGKGISAAILASILQGMIYSHLLAEVPLDEIVGTVNRFLCQKSLGGKYATLVIVQVSPDGKMDFVNCGHVPPLVVRGNEVIRTEPCNVPVGLIPTVDYKPSAGKLQAGDRLILVTDGVTEAENAEGDLFGDHRLCSAAACDSPFDNVLEQVREFCGPTPFSDDCTIAELTFKGN